MKIIFFFLIFTFQKALAQYSSAIPNFDFKRISPNKTEQTWFTYDDVRYLPVTCIQKMNAINKTPLNLKNWWDKTVDVKNVVIKPRREFSRVLQNNDVWILMYKHRMGTIHYHAVFFKLGKNKVQSISTGVSDIELHALSDVERAIKNKNIHFKNLRNSGDNHLF